MEGVREALQSIIDYVLWLLPDMDLTTLQALATVGTLIVTVILAKATKEYTAATMRMVQMQADDTTAKAVPLVLLDLGPRAAQGDSFNYMARNVGRGAALNCFELDDLKTDDQDVRVLGALLPGREVLVPDALNERLQAQPQKLDKDAFYVVAQPAVGTEWVASVNRLDRNGRVSHEVAPWTPTAKLREKMRMITLDEQLSAYYRDNVQTNEAES